MPQKKAPKITHYIHDLTPGLVGQILMRAMADDFETISEHPERKCFDVQGRLIRLALYKVPKEIAEKLRLMRLKGDIKFREFIQIDDGDLNEVLEEATDPSRSKAGEKEKQAVARLGELLKKRRPKAVKKRRARACA
jgi:hypothetical protein